jgi:pyruvate dehydrogenase E2 component (dihydrolipoamide acetyltransferase)
MAKNMAFPKIGVNMTEAVVIRWFVKPGDRISEGDAIMEAETDKSVQEIYSTESGIVAELLYQEGDTVQCYEDLIVFIDEGEEYQKAPRATSVQSASAHIAEQQPVQRIRISPLAKKIAAEHKIDAALLSPAEPGYRIVKTDVMRFLEERKKIPGKRIRQHLASNPHVAHTQDYFRAVV